MPPPGGAHLEVDVLERHYLYVSGLCLLLVVLAACSSGTTTTACRRVPNTSPGTANPGQVDVATDHSVYAPGDTMQMHIPTPVTSGTYQLGADYLSYGPDGRPPNGAARPATGSIVSAPFRICACAVCA